MRMSTHLASYLALEPHHAKRHALGLRSKTNCGLARRHVHPTVLRFDPTHPFACRACAEVVTIEDEAAEDT
jgi:hypothetical protein